MAQIHLAHKSAVAMTKAVSNRESIHFVIIAGPEVRKSEAFSHFGP